MGQSSSRIRKSKHKSKVKQLFDLFYQQIVPFSNKPSRQFPSKWFNENLEPNVKLSTQSCGNLPKRSSDSFIKYYQQFMSSGNSLKFKEISDVRYIEQFFEAIKYRCILNKKYKIFGQVWIVVNTGKIYKIQLKEEYTGPSAFDIQWKLQTQKMIQWNNDPKNRKYLVQNKKNQKISDQDIYQQKKRKEQQHIMGTYYQQRKQGTFGGTYWH